MKIGQYINYTPDSEEAECESAQEDNGYGLQKFTRKTLNWQVLSNEGGQVKLISDIFGADSGSVSANEMTFKGAEGYNNGVWELNRICSSLYGHSGATTRSVNLDDFNSSNSSITQTTGSAQTLGSSHRTVPGLYPSEEAQKSGGLKQSEQNEKYTGGATTSVTTAKNTYWEGSIQSNSPLYNSTAYWLSSRSVGADSNGSYGYYVSFYLQYADTGVSYFNPWTSYNNNSRTSYNGVRAVVTLPANATFGTETGDQDTPITINWPGDQNEYICERCKSGDTQHQASSVGDGCYLSDSIICSVCGHYFYTISCSGKGADYGKCFNEVVRIPPCECDTEVGEVVT